VPAALGGDVLESLQRVPLGPEFSPNSDAAELAGAPLAELLANFLQVECRVVLDNVAEADPVVPAPRRVATRLYATRKRFQHASNRFPTLDASFYGATSDEAEFAKVVNAVRGPAPVSVRALNEPVLR